MYNVLRSIYETLFMKDPKAGDINRNTANTGTGPYMFKEWVSGDHITLVKNINYWQGTPKFDSIIYKVVPEMATAVTMLESREADFMLNTPPEHLDRITPI